MMAATLETDSPRSPIIPDGAGAIPDNAAKVYKRIRLHPQQKAFRESSALYNGFVGGRGSGKTWAGAYKMITKAKRGRTYLTASPTGILMKDTTFPTFKEIARDLGVLGKVTISPYPNVELTTGATIRFRTAEDPEKLRGPNLSGVWLDEASLMHPDAYKIAIACLREGGEQGWLDATFTPKGLDHWTYDVFGKNKPDTRIFHCNTLANPFLPPEFAETLAKQYTEAEARQELAGEFIDADEAMKVIPVTWIRAAMNRWSPDGHNGYPVGTTGVDVARGGGAKTVFARRRRFWWDRLTKLPGHLTPNGDSVADYLLPTVQENPRMLIVIDCIGVGASPFDEMRKRGWHVMGCNFAVKVAATDSTGTHRFANMRAFAWWSMREVLDPRNGFNPQLPPDDELLADLSAPKYQHTAGGILLEKKEDIEERLGRSVDCGDAVVYSILTPGPGA